MIWITSTARSSIAGTRSSWESIKPVFPEFVGKALAAYGPDELWLILGNALYSEALIDKIKSAKGYDLTTSLIGLFHDIGPKTDRIRCDYYGAMSELLERNFYQPTSQWLESRGLKYTTIATWGATGPAGAHVSLRGLFPLPPLVPRNRQ